MRRIRYILLTIIIFLAPAIIAEDALLVEIMIENHRFYPEEIRVPAGRKLKLIIYNKDKTIEEFESLDFNREKIIPPGKKVHIILAPLSAGIYRFYGEFHQDTAKGILIAE